MTRNGACKMVGSPPDGGGVWYTPLSRFGTRPLFARTIFAALHPALRPARSGPETGAPSDRHLGRGQPDGGPDGEAVNRPARRRPGGCAVGELAHVQEPIEREEQQVSTETNERDEERTDQVGNEHGHEWDQAARRIGD